MLCHLIDVSLLPSFPVQANIVDVSIDSLTLPMKSSLHQLLPFNPEEKVSAPTICTLMYFKLNPPGILLAGDVFCCTGACSAQARGKKGSCFDETGKAACIRRLLSCVNKRARPKHRKATQSPREDPGLVKTAPMVWPEA